MLSKIKNWFKQLQKNRQQKKQLLQMQEYYKLLRAGSLFLQFIRKDMTEMKKKTMNRSQRRRFEQSINEKGQFNEEIVQYYALKIESLLNYIDAQLKPKKKK